jgi:NADH-quinone oxidoreductase subunit J
MNLGQAYFWICATLAVIGAVATVAAKNPIRGAMGLLLMILNIAGLFLALHAQFLAAIQLIVYAGAIVVLFLFVIMLIGPESSTPSDRRGLVSRSIGAGVFGLAGIAGMVLLVRAGLAAAAEAAPNVGTAPPAPPSDFGGIDTLGRVLFTQGLVPFELSSALLMVAIIGAVAVARGKQSDSGVPSPAVAKKSTAKEIAS